MQEADRSHLVDIRTIKLEKNLSATQRAEQYLEQIKNPYCYLYGDSVVRIKFNENGGELKDRLRNFFISCKQA